MRALTWPDTSCCCASMASTNWKLAPTALRRCCMTLCRSVLRARDATTAGMPWPLMLLHEQQPLSSCIMLCTCCLLVWSQLTGCRMLQYYLGIWGLRH